MMFDNENFIISANNGIINGSTARIDVDAAFSKLCEAKIDKICFLSAQPIAHSRIIQWLRHTMCFFVIGFEVVSVVPNA